MNLGEVVHDPKGRDPAAAAKEVYAWIWEVHPPTPFFNPRLHVQLQPVKEQTRPNNNKETSIPQAPRWQQRVLQEEAATPKLLVMHTAVTH